MTHALTMQGYKGEVTISYEQMLSFHGGEHPGGVAVAFRVLETAFARLCPGTHPRRDDIRMVVGINGPGVVDGIECVTRAFSGGRAKIDTRADKGEAVCGEHFYFEVYYKGKGLALWLRPGTVGAEFVALVGKHASGSISPAETARLETLRDAMADRVMTAPAAALFDTVEIAAASAG